MIDKSLRLCGREAAVVQQLSHLAAEFVAVLADCGWGCPVVTQEQGGSASKPRIPFVCRGRGIPFMSMLEVIRSEGWRFS